MYYAPCLVSKNSSFDEGKFMKTHRIISGSRIAHKNSAEVKMYRFALTSALVTFFVTLSVIQAHAQKKDMAIKIDSSQSAQVSAEMRSLSRLMNLNEVPQKAILLDLMKNRLDSVGTRARGGVDTGGGTLVISKDGQRDLLDLVNFAPKLLEDRTPGILLPKDNALKAVGIQLFKSVDLELYNDLKAKIRAWHATSPYAVSILEKALKNVPLYFFNYKLGSALADKQAFGLHGRTATPVAHYLYKFGTLISRPDFESLTSINQQALILHETLRHATIVYKYQMTDENLQRMTAAVLSGPNNDWASLDSVQNISDGWAAEILRSEYERLGVEVNIDSACMILEEVSPSVACGKLREKNRSRVKTSLITLNETVKAYSDIKQEISDWLFKNPSNSSYNKMDHSFNYFSKMISFKNGEMMKFMGREAIDGAFGLDQTLKIAGALRLLNDPSTTRRSYYDAQNILLAMNRELVRLNILASK